MTPNSTADAESIFLLEDSKTTVFKVEPKYNKMITSSCTYNFLPGLLDYPNPALGKGLLKKLVNLQALENIDNLENNWNGYNAKSFDDGFVNKVRNMVLHLEESPKIFPTGRNSIQLEYKKSNGDYLEFEICDDGQIEYLQMTGDNEIEKSIDESELNFYIRSFYAI